MGDILDMFAINLSCAGDCMYILVKDQRERRFVHIVERQYGSGRCLEEW